MKKRERVYVLYKLKPGVSREEYARWLKEEHYPWGRRNRSTLLLEGYFVTGEFGTDAEPEWDNIAIIDIDDREQWYRDQEGDEAGYHWKKWESFVERSKIYFSELIDA
jgi:hypothetical protein